jgi:hypothetical protein
MTEKHFSHLPLIAIGTALCLCSLLSVIYLSDPYTDGLVAHTFFHLSLFLTVAGLVTGIGLAIRKKFAQGQYLSNLAVSFRQGILVAVLITASLLLLSHGILFWWVELTLVLFLLFLELFLNL